MSLLNYKIFHSEENPEETPLFILHGLLGSMDNWRSQAKMLSISRPVYTLDLRNHGDSPHVKGMSYREMYEDVLNVAQAENIEIFHLLGHSMGGKVAMQLALANPDSVESLIVVDIAPKPYPLWHQQMFKAVMSTPIEEVKSRQDVEAHLKDAIDDRSERSFMLKNLKRNSTGGYSWKPNLKEISRGYLKIAGFSTALDQYNKKTLFIRGGLSQYILESDNKLIHSLFPQATITTLDESGHLPHFQQANLFFNRVYKFLS